MNFDYRRAFSRNIGLVTPTEQEDLRQKTIVIAGVGGVGGISAVTLARMGFENFRLADLDTFSIENFNRQFGATISTLNQPKTDVIRNMILQINPQAQVTVIGDGVSRSNVEALVRFHHEVSRIIDEDKDPKTHVRTLFIASTDVLSLD